MDRETTTSDQSSEPSILSELKRLARRVKVEVHTLWLAFRDRRTPWYVKAILVLLLLYLASPIDLIPDVIPVLGMLDDLVVIAFALWLCYRLIPKEVMAECREKAQAADREDWLKALWKKFKAW